MTQEAAWLMTSCNSARETNELLRIQGGHTGFARLSRGLARYLYPSTVVTRAICMLSNIDPIGTR
jgi:hypothetical protein